MPFSRASHSRADALLREGVGLPTAPFHEERVAAWILRFAGSRGLHGRLDRFGNVLVAVPTGKRRARVAFVAHMDHPGFEVRRVRGERVRLEVLGGAPRAPSGMRVRLLGQAERGVVAACGPEARVGAGPRRLNAVVRGTTQEALEYGLWDLPLFRRAGNRVYARVVDDLAGCAAVLAALERLARARPRVPAWGCFTRAEEVGFIGATALARSGIVPRSAIVVSVEMSRMLPGAEQGKGPVVRVGDRRTLFDPEATQALTAVAEKVAARGRGFRYQRRILDGGTCEATAFRVLGYRATGLACPLGNYHNQGPGGVAPEYIDIRDWRMLVDLIEAAARDLPEAMGRLGSTRKRVLALYRQYRQRL